MNLEISPHIFKAPFTCLIFGPSGAGKTTMLADILKNSDHLIYPPPDRIVYFYSRNQAAFEELKKTIPKIEFIEGMPDSDMFDNSKNNLMILDDLMDKCVNDKSICQIFTVDAHHKNISTFMISHNLFSKGPYARTISLNTHYMILFSNPRDRSQIIYLARQIFPTNPNFLIESYEDSTSTHHGYLLLNLKQDTDNRLRVQSNFLSNWCVYVEKKN